MEVRWARHEEARLIARVQVESRATAYADFVDPEYLSWLTVERAEPNWLARLEGWPTGHRVLVAVDEGTVLGYAWFFLGDAVGTQCELSHLFVAPEIWGRGVGTALMAEAEKELTRSGMREGTLWVYEANERARRFYEKRGWVDDGGRRTQSRGVDITQCRYRKGLHIGSNTVI